MRQTSLRNFSVYRESGLKTSKKELFYVFLTVHYSIDFFQVTNLMQIPLFYNNIYVT